MFRGCASSAFTVSRNAKASSPKTMRPEQSTTVIPFTSRVLILSGIRNPPARLARAAQTPARPQRERNDNPVFHSLQAVVRVKMAHFAVHHEGTRTRRKAFVPSWRTAPCWRRGSRAAGYNRVFLMAYQVLARKYRPQKFSDVIGQPHVTR